MPEYEMADSFMSAFGMRRKRSCPDCGAEMENGECEECGYGKEEEEESSDVASLLEIRDDLQRLCNKIAKLIENGD